MASANGATRLYVLQVLCPGAVVIELDCAGFTDLGAARAAAAEAAAEWGLGVGNPLGARAVVADALLTAAACGADPGRCVVQVAEVGRASAAAPHGRRIVWAEPVPEPRQGRREVGRV